MRISRPGRAHEKRRRIVLHSCREDRRVGGGKLIRALYLVSFFVACVKLKRDWCSASCRWKNSINFNCQVADDSQTNDDERSRQGRRLRGTRWLAHGYVSPLSRQPVVASVGTGKLEYGNETEKDLVGQLLMKWLRAKLDSGAAGSFVFSLVSDYGDNRSGSRLAECPAQSESRLREHMSQCVNARQRVVKKTHSLDHQTRSRTCNWDLDSCC